MLSVKAFKSGPVESAETTLKAFDTVLNTEGCAPNITAEQYTGSASWNDAYKGLVVPTIEDGTTVGVNLADLSRTVSYDQINSPEEREKIKEHIVSSVPPVIWQNSVGEEVTKVAGNAVSYLRRISRIP